MTGLQLRSGLSALSDFLAAEIANVERSNLTTHSNGGGDVSSLLERGKPGRAKLHEDVSPDGGCAAVCKNRERKLQMRGRGAGGCWWT